MYWASLQKYFLKTNVKTNICLNGIDRIEVNSISFRSEDNHNQNQQLIKSAYN